MAKAKRARRSSFRTMDGGDDVLSRLDAIAAIEAAEEEARGDQAVDEGTTEIAPESAPRLGLDDRDPPTRNAKTR